MTEQQKRINKLSDILKHNNEALLITSNANVYYYTGFNGSEGTVVITKSGSYLLADFRYIEAARNIVTSCEVIMFSSYQKDLSALLSDNGIKTVYFETKKMTVFNRDRLKECFSKADIKLSPTSILDTAIENQRMIKSERELLYISRAQEIAEVSLLETLPIIKPGITEKEIKLELEYKMKNHGAEDVSFDLITIAGKKTSLPHGVPGNNVVQNGDFLTFDIGALYKGYHSDTTRTFAVGCVSNKQREIYSIVYEAQTTALQAVKPGANCRDIDKIARDIISSAGYGKCFAHSTGHGVGLDIHEAPNLSPNSDRILSRDMVVTVEPGIYLEGEFGVRIEDMVCVTEKGFNNFVRLDKTLLVL